MTSTPHAPAPQIASEISCRNLYTAALFYNQQQLKQLCTQPATTLA